MKVLCSMEDWIYTRWFSLENWRGERNYWRNEWRKKLP